MIDKTTTTRLRNEERKMQQNVWLPQTEEFVARLYNTITIHSLFSPFHIGKCMDFGIMLYENIAEFSLRNEIKKFLLTFKRWRQSDRHLICIYLLCQLPTLANFSLFYSMFSFYHFFFYGTRPAININIIASPRKFSDSIGKCSFSNKFESIRW